MTTLYGLWADVYTTTHISRKKAPHMSVRDDYGFLTTYMEYDEEDEEEVDWDSVPSSYLYPEDVDWEDFDYDY